MQYLLGPLLGALILWIYTRQIVIPKRLRDVTDTPELSHPPRTRVDGLIIGFDRTVLYASAGWLVLGFGFVVLQIVAAGANVLVNGPTCLETKRIALVGGCDLLGSCGVRFTDGSTGTASKPAVGATVCTKKEWR